MTDPRPTFAALARDAKDQVGWADFSDPAQLASATLNLAHIVCQLAAAVDQLRDVLPAQLADLTAETAALSAAVAAAAAIDDPVDYVPAPPLPARGPGAWESAEVRDAVRRLTAVRPADDDGPGWRPCTCGHPDCGAC